MTQMKTFFRDKKQPWSSCGGFLTAPSEGQMHPSPASCDLKLTLCWLVMDAKITHVTWRIILYTLFMSHSWEICMPPLIPEEMQCMFFGSATKPNHRVNHKVGRTIKCFGWKQSNPNWCSGFVFMRIIFTFMMFINRTGTFHFWILLLHYLKSFSWQIVYLFKVCIQTVGCKVAGLKDASWPYTKNCSRVLQRPWQNYSNPAII